MKSNGTPRFVGITWYLSTCAKPLLERRLLHFDSTPNSYQVMRIFAETPSKSPYMFAST
jgi:hypothetical protein